MEKIRTQNLSFSYPNSAAALRDVSLSVDEGQFVALCGPSGCGKTTLLRLLKPKISPSGTSAGEIFFEEKPISALSDREAAENIGFVFQDPDNQIVTDKVWHELAFGLESLGISSEEIRLRVAETASFFGIEPWFRKNVSELSGGQKQILNLASAMVMRPSLLILDEPTGQLDPIAATEFLHLLKRINEDLGTTVIISEHRGEELFSLCDSIIVMENGGILARGTALEVAQELLQNGSGSFFAMPTAMRVWSAVENDDVCPVSVRQGRTWLENYASKHTLSSLNASETESNANENALVLRDLWYRYKRGGEDVLRGVNCEIRKGEIFAILGGNGAGKTTALSVISGILRPLRGRVEQSGRAALMPQDPLLLFSRSTLDTDLRDTLEPLGIPKHEKERRLSEVIKLCDLDGLLERHPFDLSGGQRQSAALAKLLLLEPDILLLDEPTKGLDAASKHRLSALLKQLCENGTTVVLVSHDVEFCAVCADRCAMFFDGEIVGVAEPHTFFSNKRFYTTAAARMAADLLPLAITADEIILACGAVPPPSPTDGDFGGFSDDPTPAPDAAKAPVRRPSARSVICALILLALIPLTIIFGLRFTGERQYYFISILVILEAMLPFFLIF